MFTSLLTLRVISRQKPRNGSLPFVHAMDICVFKVRNRIFDFFENGYTWFSIYVVTNIDVKVFSF